MQSSRNRYLAIFLLLIFTIPVIYQSGHVILHHSHDSLHHNCSHEGKKANLNFDGGEISQHCEIAEYTFTQQDLPAEQPYISAIHFELEKVNFYTLPGYRIIWFNKNSSRAPPYML
jgi:hypothetical protein